MADRSGARLFRCSVDVMYAAFAGGKEPTDLTVSIVLNDSVPLSEFMAEQITVLRQWAKGRARMATSVAEGRKGRKITA